MTRTITEQDVVNAKRVMADLRRVAARCGASVQSVAAALAMELGRHCATHNIDTTQMRVVFDEVHDAVSGAARKRS